MLQLGSGLDFAGKLLEPCWKAAVAAGRGDAGRYGLAVDGNDLV